MLKVCGGASGIGRATVERFINDGAKVAIFDLNPNYEPFQKHYEKSITFFKTDCSKKAECEQNVSAVGEKFGQINHLVYSVAFFGSKSYDASESDWMTSLRSVEHFCTF